MVPRLHDSPTVDDAEERGFTLIELMVVVVIIGVLAAVAVIAYTRYLRKAHASEVPMMFGEFKVREEAFQNENGGYLNACPGAFAIAGYTPAGDPGVSGCTEGSFFPAAFPAAPDKKTDITGGLPARWSALKIQPGSGGLYCEYVAIAGTPAAAPGGTIGTTLFTTAPVKNWFYLLAQCNFSGDAAFATYSQRGDQTQLFVDNEGH